MRPGLVRTGSRPSRLSTLDSSGAPELTGGAAEPFGLFRRASFHGARCGKNGSGSSANSTTKGCNWRFATAIATAACLRSRACVCVRARARARACACARFACWPSSTKREPARDAPASARSTARHSILRSGRAERSGPVRGEIDVWSSPLVTFATGAGDCEDYAIAKVRSPASGRRVAGRPADRDHARYHPRRGTTLRGRRPARRTLADAGQSPHGDGRGRLCQELPAVVCHRPVRRHAGMPIRRCWRPMCQSWMPAPVALTSARAARLDRVLPTSIGTFRPAAAPRGFGVVGEPDRLSRRFPSLHFNRARWRLAGWNARRQTLAGIYSMVDPGQVQRRSKIGDGVSEVAIQLRRIFALRRSVGANF